MTEEISSEEMAGLIQHLINVGLGVDVADEPSGRKFLMTAPATGQRFRVSVIAEYVRVKRTGECTACGNEREIRAVRRGWCGSCYRAWQRAGKPDSGPPRPRWSRDPDGHMEDTIFLLKAGETDNQVLASRVGVTVRSIRRYRQQLQETGVTP